MSPLEAIGGIIALGLMGGGLKLYLMNRKKPEIKQPPSPRIIDEDKVVEPESVEPEPVPTTVAAPMKVAKKKTTSKRKKGRRSRKKK
jgi:hypothetical protein